MPFPKYVQAGADAFRKVVGEDSRLESWVRRRYRKRVATRVEKKSGPGWVQWSGRAFTVVSESEDLPEPRRGIVLQGGCDVPSMFTVAPLIRDSIEGTIAIAKTASGGASRHRMDQLVQTLEDIDPEVTAETREQLHLTEDYFRPHLFQPTFTIRGMPELGTFPQNVVVLSIAADTTRTAYRHREHGFMVDPGGWWLNHSLDGVLQDLSAVEWFRANFKAAGKEPLDVFDTSIRRVVTELDNRASSKVMVYNTLVIEPGNPVHNYQLVKKPHSARRREFIITLAEAAADLGFAVVDIDRILKSGGVQEQVDFAHFPVEKTVPIGEDAVSILKDMEIL